MAERELKVVISAVDNLTGPFNSAMTNARHNAERTSSGISAAFSGISAAWIKVGVIIAASRWFVSAAKEALEAEAAFNRLRIQVEALGISYASVSPAIETAIKATSEYAIVQDEEVAAVLQKLILHTGNLEKSLTNLNAVYDLAALSGKDVNEVAVLFGKAISGNIEGLSRLFPELKNVEELLGKYATNAEEAAYAQAFLTEKSGEASSQMTEHEKTIRRVTNAYHDFHEAVGWVLVGLMDMRDALIDAVKSPITYFNWLAGGIDKVAAALNPYAGVVEEAAKTTTALTKAVKTAAEIAADIKAKGAGKIKIQAEVEIETFARGMSVGEIQRGLAAAMLPLQEQIALKAPRLDMPITLDWTLLSDARDMEAEMDSLAQKRERDKEEQLNLLTILMVEENALNAERIKSYVLNSDIVLAAQKSMSDQMLALVEIGKFSTEEFGKVIIAQVKMTLVGIAAEATIRAAYATALGFFYAATGNPVASELAFIAAAEMAATAGISLASAAGVQTLFGGQTTRSAAGSVGGEPIRTSPSVPQAASAAEAITTQTQNVTVIIQNGTGDNTYWQKLIDDVIVPGINDAVNRNINLTVRTV